MTVASQVKQTLASLKSAQATLKIYAIQSQSIEARRTFQNATETTAAIIIELEQRVNQLELEEPQYKGF